MCQALYFALLPPSSPLLRFSSSLMSSNSGTKRRRETVTSNQSSPAVPTTSSISSTAAAVATSTSTSAAAAHRTRPRVSDIASPPKKKHKDGSVRNKGAAPSGDPAVSSSDPEDAVISGDEATDGGLKAVASVVSRARRRRQTADERRERFQRNHKHETPEETLGEYSPTRCTYMIGLIMSDFLQRRSQTRGTRVCTTTTRPLRSFLVPRVATYTALSARSECFRLRLSLQY